MLCLYGPRTREKNFFVTPVELLLVVTNKGVDHASYRRFSARADKVEVQHLLHGFRLHAPYHRLGGLGEQNVVSGVDTIAVDQTQRLANQCAHLGEERLVLRQVS